MAVKLSLGCFGLIKPEVDLIHTILRTSSRLDGCWALVDQDECDAIVLYESSNDFFPLKLKSTTELISIRKRGEIQTGYVFYKPFRADELIDILLLIQSNIESAPSESSAKNTPSPKKTFKLKKWPSAEILAIDKHYTPMSIYLSRGAKTLHDLILLSGQTEEFCTKFLTLLESKALLNTEIIPVPKILNFDNGNYGKSQKKNFFSQLRDKLGLSRNF